MEFIEYFKQKEADLIKVIGEKDWKENKMYFVDEILSMVAEWEVKKLNKPDVIGRSEQFNCLGGNYAKGITECKEWCGEDMCQKPSN